MYWLLNADIFSIKYFFRVILIYKICIFSVISLLYRVLRELPTAETLVHSLSSVCQESSLCSERTCIFSLPEIARAEAYRRGGALLYRYLISLRIGKTISTRGPFLIDFSVLPTREFIQLPFAAVAGAASACARSKCPLSRFAGRPARAVCFFAESRDIVCRSSVHPFARRPFYRLALALKTFLLVHLGRPRARARVYVWCLLCVSPCVRVWGTEVLQIFALKGGFGQNSDKSRRTDKIRSAALSRMSRQW